MAASPDRALLILSIDVPEDRGDARIARNALSELHRRHTQATWVMSDPAGSPLTDELTGGAPQETAIAVDTTTSGGFDQAARRLLRAQTRGVRISAITLDRASSLDSDSSAALVRLGVAAVRTKTTPDATGAASLVRWLSPAGGRSPQPAALRWGLWELPVTDDVANASPRRLEARLLRAVRDRMVIHVRLDLRPVTGASATEMTTWQRLLDRAAAERREGRLRIEGMAAAVERLVRPREAAPARSILRPAA